RARGGSGTRIETASGDDTASAAAAAAKADLAVVVVGFDAKSELEGSDRKSLALPAGQDELIAAVAKANPHTVVVLNGGGPVEMSKWLNATPAVLEMWYGGQEGGRALAAVLFGDANPSGKLPITFPREWKDEPAYGNYPGENLHVTYAEGIYVGYRHFDTKHVEPLFPFGHGLSYTTFEYSDLRFRAPAAKGEPAIVAVKVKNSGSRAGAEVVQVYVHQERPAIDRPEQELKGFQRVVLEPGQEKDVAFQLDRLAFSYYDPAKHDWVQGTGEFEVRVGASSRDIRQKGTTQIGQ